MCRVDDWRGGVREWGFTGTGGFRCTGVSVPPIAPFPVAAHQTGRADFPHPAFGRLSPQGIHADPPRVLFGLVVERLVEALEL